MSNPAPSRQSILFIAGDVSGDVHSAAVARALLARDPTRSLHALGGKRLREVVDQSPGGRFLADSTNRSAIGVLSAIGIYFQCRKLRDELRKFVRNYRIDLIVLCDWGAFNGRVLPELHALGVPILYYFPPRSWERTGSSGLGIVPYVTRIATPFPWSAQRLRNAGADAEWVGHPSQENVPPVSERPVVRMKFGAGPNDTLIALLPGSRPSEVRVLASRVAETASVVSQKLPAKFVAVVPSELEAETRKYLPSFIQLVTDCAKELLFASDAAVVKTGTGTLEAVIAGAPQVTIYDASVAGRAEWLLLWAWRWVPFIAMPNIILQRKAVPELWGLACRPEKIARALMNILPGQPAREKMLRDYATIRQALGSELPVPPTERTAQIVEEMLEETMGRIKSGRVAVPAQ